MSPDLLGVGVIVAGLMALFYLRRARAHSTSQGAQSALFRPLPAWAIVACLIAASSLIRVYHGGGIGLQVVLKDSPSFTDTVVNLDDIFGMPRIAVAAQHPAVKRQLEAMGLVKTDKAIEAETKERIQREMSEAMEKARRDVEEQAARMRRILGTE